MPPFESDQSAFNFATEYLRDISWSFKICKKARFTEDIDLWLKALKGLYAEVSVKLSETEEKEFLGDQNQKVDFKKLTDNIIEKEEANFKNINTLINNPEFKFKYRKIIFYLLDTLEIKLRRVAQKKGMLLPSRADPRFAVLER